MAQQKIQSVQLSETGVIPGEYTSTNITVDAAGRITSAANGSGGGGYYTAGNLINTELFETNEIAIRDIFIDELGGNNNIFVGPNAGIDLRATPGPGGPNVSNIVIGALAADEFTEGDRNIFIGTEAGCQLVTGSANLFIGYQAGKQQAIDSGGVLSHKFIINDESVRTPQLFAPYISGDMNTGFESHLRLAGSFTVSTDDGVDIFGLHNTGELQIEGNPGEPGQVIMSDGPGSPVYWGSGGSVSISEPLNQLVYGTGSGITSSSFLTYNTTNGQYFLNNTINDPSGKLVVPIPGVVRIDAASTTTVDQTGGSIYISAGNANAHTLDQAVGGGVIIESGFVVYDSGDWGQASINLGQASENYGSRVDIYGGQSKGGGGIYLSAASASESGFNPGVVSIQSGSAAGGADGGGISLNAGSSDDLTGGHIYLRAGSGDIGGDTIVELSTGNGTNGVFKVIYQSEGADILFQVANSGEISIRNNNPGSAGEVLTSDGPGNSAYWAPVTSPPTVTSLSLACSDETTPLTVGTNKIRFINPYPTAFIITGVVASLNTAQTSGAIFTVDINRENVSILSTKLTIDNGEKNSSTATTPPVLSSTFISSYSEIEIDIDQVGNGTATGLKVYIIGNLS